MNKKTFRIKFQRQNKFKHVCMTMCIKKHNFPSFILRKIAYLWVSYHFFLKPLTISSTSNIQGYTYMPRIKFVKYDIDHTDDMDIVINTDDLNYIIGNDKPNCLHLQIYFPKWKMILSVKRSLWVLHGLIVWRLFLCWHNVTVMLIFFLLFYYYQV